ncbi:coadhesin-like isoform X5 [Orbicella faveolata]|uniref:coadhesin-like isoform X5 n=1 Tax=Orbicella faveolata TaxID=48498 RepID=UPI0009E19F56|nr:coadhesin-like isoform X5 [Orbicella faveolata]
MALLMKIFGFTSILFALPRIPATIEYSSFSCPKISNIEDDCGARVENICFADSDCSQEKKCCPRAADGGCSLMCAKPRSLEGCPIPLDFALIVDTSGSIGRRDFKKLLDFIEEIVDEFDISEDGTRIAIVEYSTNPSVQVKFNDFSGAALNAANLKRKVRKIPHNRGKTYIDKALAMANRDVFSAKGGMRPDVLKVALVMTDGKQTLKDEDSDLAIDILSAAVQPLKKKGIRVISLGIGPNTQLLDLLTLASTDNDVYLAQDFTELRNLVTELTERKCPVNGNWSEWSDWNECTVTCGGGEQNRFRSCDNPLPAFGGKPCPGERQGTRPCNEFPCAVDGRWSEWKDWEICSVTCGGGTQSRIRTCTNPPPAHGGKDCIGEGVITRACNEDPCPVDANWSEWSEFSPCTLSCGGGTHTRSRTCTNPPPKFDGQDCVGEGVDVQPCNTLPCPVDGKWTVWRGWSICTRTCGGGVQGRSRTCTNPPPAFGGAQCTGAREETRSCNEEPCPGDGKWSAWKAWTPCTVTCAGGTQSRSRTCTNPPPTHGGKECSGNGDETRSCNGRPCPVDGRWTRWSDWDACPVKCGGGFQARSRSCTNPPPAFGGAMCAGQRQQVQACNVQPCGIDGNWARWQRWSVCTKSCGGGTQDRTRTCSNPPPAYGGRDCRGKNKEARSCNNRPCPVDGNWAAWKAWGRCSRTCGGGTQVRSRTCTNPPPAFRGLRCPGRGTETQSCNEDIPCPVPGGWSYWGYWGRCSVSCGTGIQYRYRTCTNPPPAFGGAQCLGYNSQSYICYREDCPVDGSWGRWERWSRCSATCSGGKKRRERYCNKPRPSNGGKDCPGDGVEVIRCNTKPCSVDGKWGRWTKWSACSKTCGGYGKRTRDRQCDSPPPAHGGRDCIGSNMGMVYCNTYIPCQVTCNVPLDFAIIVDTSGSISRRNFKLLLRFIRSLVNSFQVSEDHTHIAIIEYSTGASVQLRFNDLPGSKLTKNNVYEIVKRIPHKRGKTYIDRALRLANDEVFTLKGGMRDDVRKVSWFACDINGISRSGILGLYSRTSSKRPPKMSSLGGRLRGVVAYESFDNIGSKFCLISV